MYHISINSPKKKQFPPSILDSGCSKNFLMYHDNHLPTFHSTKAFHETLPNGTTTKSTQYTHLPLKQLPKTARITYLFPDILNHSLISIIQLRNTGCHDTFTSYKSTITYQNKVIIKATKDDITGLYHTTPIDSNEQPQCNCNKRYPCLCIRKPQCMSVIVKILTSPIKDLV